MEPGHLVGLRVRQHNALEVRIIALLDVVGIQRGANLQRGRRLVCGHMGKTIFLQLGFTLSRFPAAFLTMDNESPFVLDGAAVDELIFRPTC